MNLFKDGFRFFETNEIQGLIGIRNDFDSVYMHWACTAPRNNEHEFGVQKYCSRNTRTEAAKTSLDRWLLYAFIDLPEALAANLLAKHGVLPKIGRVMIREDTDYVLVEAQIRKKDKQKFLDAMEDLKTKMLICGHRDYADRAGELIRELEMNLVEEYMQDEKLMKKLGLADKNIVIVDD